MSSTLVTKSDGTREAYNEDKIITSATRVGVPTELQHEMLEHIRSRLYDGVKTSEIFAQIQEFLQAHQSGHLAMKYNLKTALTELGPSGYPFEKYLSLLLVELGYVTETNQTLNGACVTHEIDVLAHKDLPAQAGDTTYFIEAKFHQSTNQRTDVRVALYIKARYDDLLTSWNRGATQAWIITNTRFSTDAIKYAECQKLRLTSWAYPKGQGLVDLIEHTRLHPITMIPEFSRDDKLRLLSAGVVTCRQLLDPRYLELIPTSLRETLLPKLKLIC